MRSAVLLVLAGLAAPAMAQDNAPQNASHQSKSEKKVCRMVDTTGSILGGKRECHTKAEWAEMAERARQARQNRENVGGTSTMSRSE